MANVAAIRTGIQTVLEAIATTQRANAEPYPLTVYSQWPANPQPPAAWVRPVGHGPLTLDQRTRTHRFEIVVAVSMADFEAGQERLDSYYSDSGDDSILAALLDDDTDLDGTVSGILNVAVRDYGDLEIAEQVFLGFVLELEAF